MIGRQDFSFKDLKNDLFGGLTAAIVALPLALAFGVAAGAGPMAGIYGAIAVGFFAAVFGGTRSQVSGPTGPMTIVMAAVVAQYADHLAEAFTIVMLGGLMQIGFGLLKLGRYIIYTPVMVVSGFMSGIGVIIILIQIMPFFGVDSPGNPLEAVMAWPTILTDFKLDALIVGAISLGIMIVWRGRPGIIAPPPLVALVVGTLAGLFFFSKAPILGEIPTGLPALVTPFLSLPDIPEMVQPAFILAVLGSIDSLLTSLVADQITRTKHDSNRELIGQGIGNFAAGLIGGLPGAGATMRTVINVRAGGRSPVSGAFHALVLLALVLGLAPMAEPIPNAVLAGILIKVGWDIIDWGFVKRLNRVPLQDAAIMLVTLLLTVFVDLITAVAVGVIMSGFVAARRVEEIEIGGISHADGEGGLNGYRLKEKERHEILAANGAIALFRFSGMLSYASARELSRVAGSAGVNHVLIYDFSVVRMIDLSAAMAIEELIKAEQGGRKTVMLVMPQGNALATLERLGVVKSIAKTYQFQSVEAALLVATKLVDENK
ncbi:MAG: SulP family inorganic anion transporter [Rhizobiales bacterium]|nr:SulP family inorganic anion transporter [Hyphomicrobiales bacterium]